MPISLRCLSVYSTAMGKGHSEKSQVKEHGATNQRYYLSWYIYTPDAFFRRISYRLCCNYHIAADFRSRFTLYCLRFTPFQLSAVCFFSLHAAQHVMITRHLWNKLSEEIRETKRGILKRDTLLSLSQSLSFDDCV